MSADHVHVSDLRWDRLLADELADAAKAEVLAAAAECETCAARHAELTRERDSFERRPAFALRPPARSRWWLAAPAVLAAAAVILLVVRVRQAPEQPGERVKGVGPALVVEAGASGHLAPVASGDRVHRGDYVQAAYSSSRDGFGAVLGRDGTGRASTYVPASGDTMVALPAGALRSFPASTVLDDVIGEETVLVVWCEAARPLAPLVTELAAQGDITAHEGCWHRRLVLVKEAAPQ